MQQQQQQDDEEHETIEIDRPNAPNLNQSIDLSIDKQIDSDELHRQQSNESNGSIRIELHFSNPCESELEPEPMVA